MSTLLDERCLTIYQSPSGKHHVGGWFGLTLCGTPVIRRGNQEWSYVDLTSVRHLGRMAQIPIPSKRWCKRCLRNYKDVDTNAD